MTTSSKIRKALDVLDAASRLPANLCPPVERRIEKNLVQIELLRASGLTWRQIVFGLPSWCQKDGSRVSEDQIRGAFSRIYRKQKRGGSNTGDARATMIAPRPVGPKKASASQNLPATAQPSSLAAQLELTRKSRN